MLRLNLHDMTTYFAGFLMPMLRTSAFVASAPIFNSKSNPMRIKIILILAITMVTAPMVPKPLLEVSFGNVFTHLITGFFAGFLLTIVFQIFTNAGQFIAMQSGLGFSSMVDPATGHQAPLVGNLYFTLTGLVFIMFDGHLMLIQYLTTTYHADYFSLEQSQQTLNQFIAHSAWLFKGAVYLTLPAIISLLLVNISFAIITRAAPQINIFTIGFPITLVIGLTLVMISLNKIPYFLNQFLTQTMGQGIV